MHVVHLFFSVRSRIEHVVRILPYRTGSWNMFIHKSNDGDFILKKYFNHYKSFFLTMSCFWLSSERGNIGLNAHV